MKFLIGFRKWLMAIIYILVAIVLLVTGKIGAEGWLDNVSEVMVAFMATNIGEHLVNVTKEWLSEKKFSGINKLLGDTDA